MVFFIHDRRPTGIGESLSGARAFYINSAQIDDWRSVETHPEFRSLDPEDQETIKAGFPRSVEIHRILKNTSCH
ncbi:MAG: hypothetical protein A2075_11330 [Geobacteraceae bacterium GWC2_58_44]|nr:MAG: hypothetical protein A2075_11330 [Geobacteraceae bacterium GWC2_58_44]HBG04857.1 hypothetical protein [Geobacter sp.]